MLNMSLFKTSRTIKLEGVLGYHFRWIFKKKGIMFDFFIKL